MKSPKKSIGFGRSHKGFSGLKKYSIELRLRALEDLKNGVSMEKFLETHGINSERFEHVLLFCNANSGTCGDFLKIYFVINPILTFLFQFPKERETMG
jgi:hypothetical protein